MSLALLDGCGGLPSQCAPPGWPATPYGLRGSIWFGELDRAERVARQLCPGGVDFNGDPFNILTRSAG